MNDVTAGLGSPRALLPGSGRSQPPPHWTWAEHRAGRRGSHRAKRGTGSEATLTAPPPAPPSSKSRGRALSAHALGSDFVRFFRTSSTRQPSRTCRPRRSHTNDVNPQQPRHVHKPPAHKGVMQPSAIGAGDDCCDRGRSRSSRALWRRAARQAAPGAHDGSPTGCDSRAHGVAVTAGGPEFGPPYDGRLLTDDRGLAASRLPDGRNGRSVAATLPLPFTGGQAPARVRMSTALTPEGSGAAEGVRDGRRPARVQIDDSRRRGPFSGL